MYSVLHPTYFPNIVTFALLERSNVVWEVEDNYQKQTFRNRCHIATDQGLHMLNIPIKHVGGNEGRQKYKTVQLDNSYAWQRQHWRTLQTAYRASPFFEYYEDEIAPLFEKRHTQLLDFNFKTIETICQCLQIEMPMEKTSRYQKDIMDPSTRQVPFMDVRYLVNAKKRLAFTQPPYAQVFADRHGFLENLSILDLLFNEGPRATVLLQDLKLDFIDA